MNKMSYIFGNFTKRESRTRNLVSHLEVSVSRESLPIEEFYIVTEKSSNGHDAKHYVSDVYMLFNQKRLDRMTNEALIDYLQSSSAPDDGLGELRKNVPVDRLCDFVKSRYIQSPSELRAWSHTLMDEYNAILRDIPSAEPSSSPTPAEPSSSPAVE